MQKNTNSTNFLRWLTICLLFALSALLFFANLINTSAQTTNSATPTTMAPSFLTETAAAKVRATKTAGASATAFATDIAKNPYQLQQSAVTVPLIISDKRKFLAKDHNAIKNVAGQINANLQPTAKVALVFIYVGFTKQGSQVDTSGLAQTIQNIFTDQNTLIKADLSKAIYQQIIFQDSIIDAGGNSFNVTPGSSDAEELVIYLYSTPNPPSG